MTLEVEARKVASDSAGVETGLPIDELLDWEEGDNTERIEVEGAG